MRSSLLDALKAQAQTGLMLKSFALVTIVIGVASALMLSTYRRRPEIGIMRAMGAPRSFVVIVFVMQGAMIGLVGGLMGAGIGYAVLLAFPGREAFKPGNLPIDIAQGAYGRRDPAHRHQRHARRHPARTRRLARRSRDGDRPMTEPLLEVRDLWKIFGEGDAETRVLKGLDLTMARGELSALLGPSGSGKSTLLTILGTLMQPTSGSHMMLGQDLTIASDQDLTEFRNLHIGFVFQFHNLLPDFTALENVIFPTAVREGRETAAARERGRELLVRMGLADRIDYPSTSLSGGQKQRVAVARALMNRPEFVLADEPTGNLDRASANQVMELIGEINREEGTTFLISTHDEKIAARCQRQILVGDGRVTG